MKILKRFWNWVRFGKVRCEVVFVGGRVLESPFYGQGGRVCGWSRRQVGGTIGEIVYYDRNGRVCGRWVAGSFDTALPYRGE